MTSRSRAAVLGLLTALTLSPALAHAEAPVRCARLEFAVSLAPGAPADQTLVGWLCTRGSIEHKTLQILLHGGTYDHNYWAFPFEPQTYSYVDYITSAGYAVLNVDRIGSGESSIPPDGAALTLHTGAFTVHQLVQALRAGRVTPEFGNVIASRIELVGHSLGALISGVEAADYGDVDGVILSGYSHTRGPTNPVLETSIIPAFLDPKFASLGLGPVYFSTPFPVRSQSFYYLPNADPTVVALDYDLRQLVALGEVIDILPSFTRSIDIHVPTLVAMGDYDFITCELPSCIVSNSQANEASFYSSDACVEIEIVQDSGHDLNLQRNAPTWYALARDWSDRRVGASTKLPAPQPCPH